MSLITLSFEGPWYKPQQPKFGLSANESRRNSWTGWNFLTKQKTNDSLPFTYHDWFFQIFNNILSTRFVASSQYGSKMYWFLAHKN